MSLKQPASAETSVVRPIVVQDGRIRLLDQRKIPESVEYVDATGLEEMCQAIKDMVVRGAPAIGVAAALGLAAEATRLAGTGCSTPELLSGLDEGKLRLQSARPTAVNLRWATELICEVARKKAGETASSLARQLFVAAESLIQSDVQANMLLSEHGARLIGETCSVLTHCNAGALATCGWGTALGVLRWAHMQGSRLTVYVDETRPRQQGARLTTWELLQDKITPTLITDGMAGSLMAQNKIDMVIVGADRIATNGDVANKIGTYTLAVLAHHHNVPFYVAAPLSTIDPFIENGRQIPIEERHASEVTSLGGQPQCPPGVQVFNPAFDVTPAELVTGIITEAGILEPPYEKSIKKAIGEARFGLLDELMRAGP